MKQYQDLLRRVLAAPHKPSRGVIHVEGVEVPVSGTRSLFGEQLRFDLADGFPLVTTKRMFVNGIIDELLWFLTGSTNAFDLPARSQKWWTPWARADGQLGPIYGAQYRHARWWFEVEPKLFEPPEVVKQDGLFCGVGDLGETKSARGLSAEEHALRDVWRDMLKRCYDENSKSFESYGAVGVHVDPEWLLFDNFSQDARTLQGWHLKLEYPDDYSLDKDVLCASNRYSKATCIWASHVEQSLNTSTGTPFHVVDPEGNEVFPPSFGEANRRCTIRFREIDQLKRLIAGLKRDPHGRRHLINLWNTPAMEHAQLPCCHGSIIQFYVTADGRLSCQAYQRSADIFIGVPVNIASYALLTHLVANDVGLKVGEFVHTFGDVHLYDNHVDQAHLQLTREPRGLPVLLLARPDISVMKVTRADIDLVGYDPHPRIPAIVAI